jgi:hypothetical protein
MEILDKEKRSGIFGFFILMKKVIKHGLSGVDVLKFFSPSQTKGPNKLKYLLQGSFSAKFNFLRIRPGAYSKGEHLKNDIA